MELARAVYEDAVGAAFYNGCVVAAVAAIIAMLPESRRLEVGLTALEVGAGTGRRWAAAAAKLYNHGCPPLGCGRSPMRAC